jgi:RHH-type proline utilization regulon transcriptional repressor/proline dehydrogenase/delta 1-pyrroline-5-carboxylate dehydrogenase
MGVGFGDTAENAMAATGKRESWSTSGSGAGSATAPLSRDEISEFYLRDESRLVGGLIERAVYTADERRRIATLAQKLVGSAREGRGKHGGLDAFMHEYGLTSEEGVTLLCLAEALLRIPDADTADALIDERVGSGQWERHLGHSDSLLVNASTWGLMLTGRIVRLGRASGSGPGALLKRLVARSGEPVIRQALRQAVKILGDQFVLGRTIESAISNARAFEKQGYLFSYDMLGEAARTQRDAERYHRRYASAIEAVAKAAGPLTGAGIDALLQRPSISIKLSALHPRFEPGKEARVAKELIPSVLELARLAKARGLAITIDAEEQDRLDPTLSVIEGLMRAPELAEWSGLGVVVQAYGKRAIPMLRWLKKLGDETRRMIPVRLVKGAYWDSEIKLAQERGLPGYPVFTAKTHTDVSYLACMRFLLSDTRTFYPQFATHNAHTVAAAHVAGTGRAFELQRLHGMGEALYDTVVDKSGLGRRCRIYAPVGAHEDLLAYLVRRLLENGANTSFVNRLADDDMPAEEIVRDPIEDTETLWQSGSLAQNLRILPPAAMLGPERRNSDGVPLAEPAVRASLLGEINDEIATDFTAGPIIDGTAIKGGDAARLVLCPHDRRRRIGTVLESKPEHVERAIVSAGKAAHTWDRRGGPERAALLERAAHLMEKDRARLMGVLVREAGKTLEAALSEVREAVDFLRYYANEAKRQFSGPVVLPGPTGERNTIDLRGRGVFACISPWNFPLAIFTGQVAAALAAGNTVIAKPAEQTPITAFLAVEILHAAGVPGNVLHLVPGDGSVGAMLSKDPRIDGIAFTGSNATAWAIQKALADRRGAIVPFIAETGGINAMIADSSALAEQVVRDVVRSAFDSAGQRCSAARLLFLQDDIADHVTDMLTGAIAELQVGDPLDYATDIGPVIDEDAQTMLEAHKLDMRRRARELIDPAMPDTCRVGTFVTPAAYAIERMEMVEREVFGPVLHVVKYDGGHLDKVIESLNGIGFGLTLGLHSRIGAVADFVAEHAKVGNLYVNRNQIGAVVGVQPFGGEGLSGTGPKAGGPHYLARFATERVRSTDVTATGGNVELLGLATPAKPEPKA